MDSAKEGQLLQMRFQWWRDTMKRIHHGNPPDHPLAIALSTVLNGRPLTKRWFTRVIDTREKDAMAVGPPRSLEALEEVTVVHVVSRHCILGKSMISVAILLTAYHSSIHSAASG